MARITQFEFLKRRNASLGANAATLTLVLLGTPVLGIALLFAVRGAWFILLFAAAEILALKLAFAAMQRCARDFDLVRVNGDEVEIRTRREGIDRAVRFNRYWTRLSIRAAPGGEAGALVLCSRGEAVEFGTHLAPEHRVRLARDLGRLLASPVPMNPLEERE